MSSVISVRSKTTWDLQRVSHGGTEGTEFRVQSSEFRVSHRGTEVTEVFISLPAPLSLSFVDSVRGIVSNRGFSKL